MTVSDDTSKAKTDHRHDKSNGIYIAGIPPGPKWTADKFFTPPGSWSKHEAPALAKAWRKSVNTHIRFNLMGSRAFEPINGRDYAHLGIESVTQMLGYMPHSRERHNRATSDAMISLAYSKGILAFVTSVDDLSVFQQLGLYLIHEVPVGIHFASSITEEQRCSILGKLVLGDTLLTWGPAPLAFDTFCGFVARRFK